MVVKILDEDDCRVNLCNRNGHGFPNASPRKYPISPNRNEGGSCNDGCDRYSRMELFGMHDDKAGSIQIGCTENNSLLLPCGRYEYPVEGMYCCPGCDAHMHPFCGDAVEEEGYGQNI